MNRSIKSSRGISSYRIWEKKKKAPMMMGNEARVMAGGWAEPCLAPPHETPGIAGIWGSQRHHLLSACIMDVV